MSQASPRGQLYHLSEHRATRAGTHISSHPELREAPPTAPLPFPIRRLPPPPVTPEPARLDGDRQQLLHATAHLCAVAHGLMDVPDHEVSNAIKTADLLRRFLASDIAQMTTTPNARSL